MGNLRQSETSLIRYYTEEGQSEPKLQIIQFLGMNTTIAYWYTDETIHSSKKIG